MHSVLPDYTALDKLCSGLDDPVNISGLHGSISGMLAVNSSTTLAACLRQYGDGEVAGDFLANFPHLGSDFEAIYGSIHYALNETEFDYQLFLPEDDADMAHRLQALIHWCNDFLLACGIAHATAGNKGYSKEIHALLSNFADFSKVESDEIEASEEAQTDYQEIIEFVRMGVIHIHSDFHTTSKQKALH